MTNSFPFAQDFPSFNTESPILQEILQSQENRDGWSLCFPTPGTQNSDCCVGTLPVSRVSVGQNGDKVSGVLWLLEKVQVQDRSRDTGEGIFLREAGRARSQISLKADNHTAMVAAHSLRNPRGIPKAEKYPSAALNKAR